MTSTPTGGTEAILHLTQAAKRHRGDFPAWQRTGGQLVVRRTLLGYPDGKRQHFVDERCRPGEPGGLTYKNIYELEHGPRWGRQAFPVHWLITAADAYEVLLESFAASLDGGDLVPASPPAPAARRPAPAALLTAAPPPAVLMSGVLSPQAIAAAAPYATRIFNRKHALAVARGIAQPSGHDLFILDLTAEQIEDVFPGDRDASYSAASRWGVYADDLPEDDRAWFIAAKHVTETAGRQLDTNVG